jgi:hypothetical protein
MNIATPSVISYRTIYPEALSIVSSEEGMIGPLNDSPGRIEPATTAATPEIVSSALVSVRGSIQVPSTGLVEVAGSSTSFSRDLAAMKEFFDFSAAAKTDARSTSSFAHVASVQGNALSKRRQDVTVTSDIEPESTDLENLGSLVELAKKVEDQGKHEWCRVLLQRVVRLVDQRTRNSDLGALIGVVLGDTSRNLRSQLQYYEADQLIENPSGTLFYIGLGKSPEALLSISVLDRATVDFEAIVRVGTALRLARAASDPDSLLYRNLNGVSALAIKIVIENLMKLHREYSSRMLTDILIWLLPKVIMHEINIFFEDLK